MLRAELRELTRLAIPIALTNLGSQLMGLVDTIMLGRYSDAALAGTGIANGVILMVQVVGMGAIMGLDTLIPQAVGAGEHGRARRMMWVGVRLALWIGLPLTLIIAVSPALYAVFDVERAVAWEGSIYTWCRLPSVLPVLLMTALRMYLQGVHVTRPLVIAMLAGNAINVALNVPLIFGVPAIGLPALGSAGAAISSVAVAIGMAAMLAFAVRAIPVAPSDEDERPLMKRTLSLGLPVGLQYGAEVGAFALAGVLAGTLGRVPAAGHQVALMLVSVMFNVALGLSSAGAVRVGRAIGAGDAPGTRRAGAAALLAVGVVMCTSAVLLFSIPGPLARLITNDPEVLAMATSLIQIAAVFQLSDGAQAVGAGVLRGAGDTRAAFAGNVVGHYGIGIPLAIVLAFPLGWGVTGLWWGLSAGLTAVAIALWARFFWRARHPIARS